MISILIVVTTRGDNEVRLECLCEEILRQSRQSDVASRLVVVSNGAPSVPHISACDYERIAISTPGVVAVRNEALDQRRYREHLLFVDDDQYPEPSWFDETINSTQKHAGDVISGAVRYVVNTKEGRWLIARGYISSERPARETLLETTGTGNTLIPAQALDANPSLRFDQRFSATGGEDTHFFAEITSQGARIVYSPEAAVNEVLDLPKQTRRHWHAKYRASGFSRAVMMKDAGASKIALLASASLRILFATARASTRRATGRPSSAVDAYRYFSGVGFIDAVRGRPHNLYE